MGEVAQVCTELSLLEKFIVPIPIPKPTPSLDPGYGGDLVPDLRGSSRSTTPHCDPAVNPTFTVRNGFFHFCGRESTQSGEYNLGLLTKHPINWDEIRGKMFLLIVEVLPVILLLHFFPPRKKCVHSLFLICICIRIYKYNINGGFYLDLS